MQEKNKSVAGAEAKVEESQVGQWDALARNMVRLFDEGTKVLGTLVERRNGSGPVQHGGGGKRGDQGAWRGRAGNG